MRITASSLLVCSNKFRQYLADHFDLRGLYLNKVGHQRKFFREGVARLSSDRGLSGGPPFSLAYNGRSLTMSPISEAEADQFEKASHKKMYVGGVGMTTSSQDVGQYFAQFGTVSFVQLMGQDKHAGTKFGFVIFADHRSLAQVYQRGSHFLRGHRLRVANYVNNTKNKVKHKQQQLSGSNVGPVNAGSNPGSRSIMAGGERQAPVDEIHLKEPVKALRHLPTAIDIVIKDASGRRLHADSGNIRFNLAVPLRLRQHH